MLLIQQIWTLKCFVYYVLLNENFAIFASNYIRIRGATINIVAYSVNVRVKFYSIEGATIYDAAYSANLDLEMLFFHYVLMNEKFQIFTSITFARGHHH